jgi:hypothetical protein
VSRYKKAVCHLFLHVISIPSDISASADWVDPPIILKEGGGSFLTIKPIYECDVVARVHIAAWQSHFVVFAVP